MNLTIPLTPAQAKGLSQATAAYNAGNVVQLTDAEFAQAMFAGQLYDWSQRCNSIPSAAFVLRFTPEEIAGIMTAAQAKDGDGNLAYPALQAYLDALASNVTVNLENAELLAGMALLVSAGLLTQQRADEILAP